MAKKPKAEDNQSWQKIKRQKGKSFEKRIKEIDEFIKANKDKETALSAYLLQAKIFLKNKKYKSACLSYHKAVQSSFDYTRRWEAYKASARCYFEAGQAISALETLEQLIQNPKESVKNKKRAAKQQWNFLKNQKLFIKWKLVSLSHLVSFSINRKEKEMWRNRGIEKLKALSFNDLMAYASQSSLFGVFEGHLLYKAGDYFFENKKFSRAKHYFGKALSSSLSIDLKKEIKNKLALIKTISKVNPYLIGVIVPLSGRRKALGEKILRGIYMGLDMEEDSPWQIIVKDSKNHPDVVRTQIDSLFYRHHIIGIFGGLTSETAEVIAEKATSFAIPAVVFSQKKGLSENRSFVFQNAITAEQLLKPIIQRAIKHLKIKEGAILRPNDLYGKEYAELFSELFIESGGRIVKQEVYKTGEVDFKKHIKELFHLNIKGREEEFEELKQKFLKNNPSLSERSKKLKPENILPAKKEFSALFIPDSLTQLWKIKDHLQYFGMKDIYLLGTNLWRPGKISRWPEVLSLLFVNLPSKNRPSVKNSPFYKNFMKTYAYSPGLFEQRAYNSSVFFKKALNKKLKSRLLLQKELRKIKSFQGAYYSISVSDEGLFNYPLKLYEISGKDIHILDSVPVK